MLDSPTSRRPTQDRLPWEAPTVLDIDVAAGTFGGGTVFSDENTFVSTVYNFSAHPLS